MDRIYMLIDSNNRVVETVLMNEFEEEKAIDYFKSSCMNWKGTFTVISDDVYHNRRIIGRQIF